MSVFPRFSPPKGRRSGGLAPEVVPPVQPVFDKTELAFSPAAGLGSGVGGRTLRTVEENAHAAAAVYLMKRARATAMVVVNDGRSNSPVGLITERDLAQSVADGHNLNDIRIRDLMISKRRSSARAATSAAAV